MRVPEQPKSAEVELIRGLEEQLLRPEVRTSPERVAALLADEFTEIGSSGRVFNKQQIIDLQRREQWDKPAGLDLRVQISQRQLRKAGAVDCGANATPASASGPGPAVDLHLDHASVLRAKRQPGSPGVSLPSLL